MLLFLLLRQPKCFKVILKWMWHKQTLCNHLFCITHSYVCLVKVSYSSKWMLPERKRERIPVPYFKELVVSISWHAGLKENRLNKLRAKVHPLPFQALITAHIFYISTTYSKHLNQDKCPIQIVQLLYFINYINKNIIKQI